MVNVGFLRAASPLVLAHVVVPPLSVVRGEGVQWLLSYDAQTRFESSMKSLMLDTNAPMHSPTRVTSMFVHADYNHMFNNICSLLLHGLPVYETFGFMGLFFVFLVGGVIASLPSFLRDSQIKEVARSVTSATTFKVGPEKSLFNPLAGAWNRHGATFCGMVAAKMFATQPSCGSSGGVSALIGCCLFLLLRDAANIVCRSMCAKSTAVSPLCLAASTLPWHVFGLHFLGYVLKKLSDVFIIAFCFHECRAIYPSDRSILESKTATQADQFKNIGSLVRIGHATHVQGLTFGFGFTLVVSLLSGLRPPPL